MGLLDIWSDWKKNNTSYSDGFEDYGSLDTAGGKTLDSAGSGINATMNRTSESPLVKNPIFTKENFKKVGNTIYDSLPGSDFDRKFATKEAQKIQGTPKGEMTPFHPSQGGDIGNHGGDQQDQLNWWQKLAKKAGIKDFDKAAANWKDKGGFDGLMSNPAFSLGLALMQSSANGKTINQGILDNFVKSAKISSEFKDRIEARKQAPIQATSQDVAEVKSLLGSMNISDPSTLEKFFGKVTGKGNVQMKFDMAAEDIANELEKEIEKLKKNKKPGAPEVVYDTTKKLQIMKRMFNEGRFKKKGGTWFTDATLESTTKIPFEERAQGGPVQQGKPYVVGEQGPEIIIPRSDGDVLTNDDSQIYAMLLASNPQLQKVSKARAEKIMRNRFPEYFEG